MCPMMRTTLFLVYTLMEGRMLLCNLVMNCLGAFLYIHL